MSAFTVEPDGRVCWITEHGPSRYDADQRERLLSIWAEGTDLATQRLYNDMHEAHEAAGGIPLVSGFRRVA